jgi:PAS domain S-box-containing protein
METLQQRGWTDNQETFIEKKDGTQAHLLYSSATFQLGGECCAVSMLVDITERKVMEEKLQQSESTLQSFFQAAPVGLAILKGRIFQAVNERICEITGHLAADLLNQSSRHLYESQEEYHRVGTALYSRLQARNTGYVETRFRHRDGSLRNVSLFAAPIDPVAPEAGVAVAIQDITDQKKMFRKLRDSEEHFRTLFESASDAILITKDNSITGRTIVDCNKKALEMFGCARHEMLGRSPRDFSPALQPDGRTYREKGAAYIAAALQGMPQHFEWLHSRFDGTLFHADVSLSAIELSGEQHIQAIVRDVSKRKAIETALRESEFRFHSFFNTNPEGILLIDFQGMLLDLNKAFLQESGYSLGECTHKHFKAFIPPEDQARIVEAILAIKSGLSQNGPLHFSYIAKDGAIVPVAAKGWLVVDENNAPLYMGIFIRNLTKEIALAEEKTALERQISQAQKSEAIGTLAGGIAHDFNNILGGIIGYTELALYRNPAAVDPKIREYLERVLEGGNRAKDLVQQILRFSKNSNVVMAPINLTPVIKESINLLRSTLPTTVAIQHQTEVASDRILGDPTQIHQVVMNLATNAYHAMRDTGGLITIALENVTLTRARQCMTMTIPPGEYLQLSVTDTGSGIPPAVLERIFEPYFTTKKVNEGTGLGMAVVRGIVKSHKGLIEITTALGKGTCFDVFLPLTQGITAEIDCRENHLALGHGERVLIVDDETFFLEVVEKCLKLLGYQVFASQSSLTTLKTFQDNPQGYDLLITDQTMPEMTGVQLTQEIRKISSTLPVILCTGYSETVTEHSAHYYGVTEFLMKPVNIHDLAQTIAAVLAKRNTA